MDEILARRNARGDHFIFLGWPRQLTKACHFLKHTTLSSDQLAYLISTQKANIDSQQENLTNEVIASEGDE